jgi:hypothetical protein
MQWFRPKERSVVVIGYPNHGKTVFLAGLFWDSFFALSEAFHDARKPYAVRAANARAGEVFFGNAITLSRLNLPPSSPRTPPEPAVLEFTGIPSLKGGRNSLRLTFYDIPGEAVSDEEWLLDNAPFLPRAHDIIFIFDPTREDFAVRALQAADLRDKIYRLVPGAERKNYIVALSKMDELRRQSDWAGMVADYWPGKPPTGGELKHYFKEMDLLSTVLRDWWADRAQGGRGFVNRVPVNTRYCALSSIGHQPEWECGECGSMQRDADPVCAECRARRNGHSPIRLVRKPEPFRVRDPLFWIFRSAGAM